MYEEVLTVEQWNEANPDDCHSPWMGMLDNEPSESAVIVEDVPRSPCTGEADLQLCDMLMTLLLCVVAIGLFTMAQKRLYKYIREHWIPSNEEQPNLHCEYAEKITGGMITGAIITNGEVNTLNIRTSEGEKNES